MIKVIDKLLDFAEWFSLEEDDADHTHGNHDGGHESTCEACIWGAASREMYEIVRELETMQQVPDDVRNAIVELLEHCEHNMLYGVPTDIDNTLRTWLDSLPKEANDG